MTVLLLLLLLLLLLYNTANFHIFYVYGKVTFNKLTDFYCSIFKGFISYKKYSVALRYQQLY